MGGIYVNFDIFLSQNILQIHGMRRYDYSSSLKTTNYIQH